MQEFLTILLQCSISMSLITLVYVAILPLLSKRYAAKWRYMVWLAIAVGWIVPFRPRIDLSSHFTQMTDLPVTSVQPIINTISSMYDAENAVNSSVAPTLWWVFSAIWIVGVVSVVVYHSFRHDRFMKMVYRWSEPVTDLESLGILNSLKSELGIKTQVKLSVCECITSPMLIGFFRPSILLPPIKIAGDELPFILKHELIHFQRRDLYHKAVILTATALHWFNPVVYIMAKSVALQCEISCDALVLQDTDFQKRKQYGETIIGVARNGAQFRTVLSTNFYGGIKGMKNRISSIMDTKRKKTGIIILCIALACIMLTGVTLAASEMLDRGMEESVNIQIPVVEGKTYVNLTQDGQLEAKGKELYNYQLFTNNKKISVSIPKGEYEGEFVLYSAENNMSIQQFVLNGTNRTKTFENLTAATNYYILASGIDDVLVTVSD